MRILLLPVDGRPITREMPVDLGAVAGVTVLTPPAQLLGFLKQPGDRKALAAWLQDAAAEADAIVVAGDTLAHGGLVPSRVLSVTTDEALEYLAVLKTIRAALPETRIYLFNTILRIANADTDMEEPAYWTDYGTRIWRWSYETHRGDPAAAAEAAHQVPAALREEYLALRESRFQVNRALLGWVKEGVLDLLIFPQDDCAQYGFHVRERSTLMAEAAESGIADRVFAYPGADEVAATLVARAVHALRGTCPAFFPFYSTEVGPDARTMYEDIPLGETVAQHVRAAGGRLTENPAEADILLAVHAPTSTQGDWFLQEKLAGSKVAEADLNRFVGRVEEAVERGLPVALADVCYANGADGALMAALVPRVRVERLAAFSAWNTAGNTLGTAVAQAGLWVCHGRPSLSAAQAKLVLTRLSDDYAYQTLTRPHYPTARLMSEAELAAAVVPGLQMKIAELHAACFGNYRLAVDPITFPWHRAFEVRVGLALNEEGSV